MLLSLLCCLTTIKGQGDNLIDSVKYKIAHEQSDSARVILYIDLFWEYLYVDRGAAKKAARDAMDLAVRVGDAPNIAECHNTFGVYYSMSGDYAESIENYLQAIKMYEELNDLRGLSSTVNNLGLVYSQQHNYEKAMEYYDRSLNIKVELNDSNGIAASYNNLGLIAMYTENYTLATDYYLKSLAIKEALNDKFSMTSTLDNLGDVAVRQENYKNGRAYFLRALEIQRGYDDLAGMSYSLRGLGEILVKQGKPKQGIVYLDTAYRYTVELEALREQSEILNLLSIAHKRAGDFRAAYEYQFLLTRAKDSLLNRENLTIMTEMETKYQTEKKEKEISLLNAQTKLDSLQLAQRDNELAKEKAEGERQTIINYGLGIGLGLVGILAGFIFVGYRNKRRANEIISAQKAEVEESNRIINTQKEIVEQKNQEILDSITYAKRIQEAILPPHELVQAHLKDSFVLYKPKDIVAGDFYWLEAPDGENGPVYFAAADCTGHGVPGAMVSVVCHNALNRAVREFELREPAAILNKVRELVIETFRAADESAGISVKDGMDIALVSLSCEIERDNGEYLRSNSKLKLSYAGANNSLILIKDGELTEVKADRQPIGKYTEEKPFTNHVLALEKGTTLYVFSDGYVDQFGGPKGKKFKIAQFKRLLLSMTGMTMEKQKLHLDTEFELWRGELEQLDDVCVIGVRN